MVVHAKSWDMTLPSFIREQDLLCHGSSRFIYRSCATGSAHIAAITIISPSFSLTKLPKSFENIFRPQLDAVVDCLECRLLNHLSMPLASTLTASMSRNGTSISHDKSWSSRDYRENHGLLTA